MDLMAQERAAVKDKLLHWENAFLSTWGRKASQVDVDKNPEITKLYARYRELKRLMSLSTPGASSSATTVLESSNSALIASLPRRKSSVDERKLVIEKTSTTSVIMSTKKMRMPPAAGYINTLRKHQEKTAQDRVDLIPLRERLVTNSNVTGTAAHVTKELSAKVIPPSNPMNISLDRTGTDSGIAETESLTKAKFQLQSRTFSKSNLLMTSNKPGKTLGIPGIVKHNGAVRKVLTSCMPSCRSSMLALPKDVQEQFRLEAGEEASAAVVRGLPFIEEPSISTEIPPATIAALSSEAKRRARIQANKAMLLALDLPNTTLPNTAVEDSDMSLPDAVAIGNGEIKPDNPMAPSLLIDTLISVDNAIESVKDVSLPPLSTEALRKQKMMRNRQFLSELCIENLIVGDKVDEERDVHVASDSKKIASNMASTSSSSSATLDDLAMTGDCMSDGGHSEAEVESSDEDDDMIDGDMPDDSDHELNEHESKQVANSSLNALASVQQSVFSTVRRLREAASLPSSTTDSSNKGIPSSKMGANNTFQLAPSGKKRKLSSIESAPLSDNFVRYNSKRKGTFKRKYRKKPKGRRIAGDNEDDEGFIAPQHLSLISNERGAIANSGELETVTAICSAASETLKSTSKSKYGSQMDIIDACIDAIEGETINAVTSNGDIPEISSKVAVKIPAEEGIKPASLNLAPPLCPGHQADAILRTVKKEGANKGRKFWCCGEPRGGGQCEYFEWEEDVIGTALGKFLQGRGGDSLLASSRATTNTMFTRWKQMTVPELRKICKRYGLDHKGKKTELLELLVMSHATTAIGGMSDALTSAENPSAAYAPSALRTTEGVSSLLRKSKRSKFDADSASDEDSECDDEKRVDPMFRTLRRMFRFKAFRGGQEWAVRRVLKGLNTLLVLPTGGGKSLTYQLPAALLPGLTLVVSPLLSLMEDQVMHLPPGLPGAALTSQTTKVETASLLRDLKMRQIKILFVSPERLFTSSFQRLLRTPGMLPNISLFVIDEAHCLSEWSHNFRPSYLRLHQIVDALKPRPPILALTATATQPVLQEISRSLNMMSSTVEDSCEDESGSVDAGKLITVESNADSAVLVASVKRSNLQLTVSCDKDRFSALLSLLRTQAFSNATSVIIYVFKRMETESVSSNLNEYGYKAAAYHGGMSTVDRKKVQSSFLRGSTRIVVATVAFGMGIDKNDVTGVIHYNAPKSLESYIQEVGRSGRDGSLAICHAFLDVEDMRRMHTLTFSDGVDEWSVRLLLDRIFDKVEAGQDVTLSIEAICLECDMRESAVETVLTILSMPPFNAIQLLPSLYATFIMRPGQDNKVRSLLDVAKKDVMVAAALNTIGVDCSLHSAPCPSEVSMNIVEMAKLLHSDVTSVRRGIFGLCERRLISCEWKDWSFFITRLASPTEEEKRDIASHVTTKLEALVQRSLQKLNIVYHTLNQIATPSLKLADFGTTSSKIDADDRMDRVHRLTHNIELYFTDTSSNHDALGSIEDIPMKEPNDSVINSIRRDFELLRKTVEAMNLSSQQSSSGKTRLVLTPRVAARIFSGLGSVAFPAEEWRNKPCWNRYNDVNFETLLQIARDSITAA